MGFQLIKYKLDLVWNRSLQLFEARTVPFCSSSRMGVLCSHLGDVNGDGKGGFVVFDQDFNIKGTWGDQLTECATHRIPSVVPIKSVRASLAYSVDCSSDMLHFHMHVLMHYLHDQRDCGYLN